MLNVNLFKNKKTKETQPDYRGSVKNDMGEEIIEVAGWIKKTKSGDDYISLSVKRKAVSEIQETPDLDDLPF